MGGIPVEDGHPPAVPTWHVGCEDAVAHQHALVNLILELGLLEYPQVEVGLSHLL